MIDKNSKCILRKLRDIVIAEDTALISMNDGSLQINEIVLIVKLYGLLKGKTNTTSQLARELSVTPSTISNMLNKLQKKGFIKRVNDDFDRRKVYVLPIGKSKEVKDKYLEFYENINLKIQAKYSKDDLSLINDILKSIETNLN